MTDVVVDRLRIRGADGRRLAAVAARTLPSALERALADIDDARLGQLSVTLDVDPCDYDDVTLAVLWADRIRHAALASGARPRAVHTLAVADVDAASVHPGETASRPAGQVQQEPARADLDLLTAAVVSWLDAGSEPSAIPVGIAALANLGLAAAVAGRVGATRTTHLVQALKRAAHQRPERPDGTAGGVRRPHSGTRPADGVWHTPAHRGAHDGATHTPGPGQGDPTEPVEQVVAAARALRPLFDLAAGADGTASTADLGRATQVAGLVVLYPWLADLCREAEAWHPGLDPTDVRRSALTALADPFDPGLADDPLVLFLAGAQPDAAPSSGLAQLDASEQIGAAADAVLARFAALLPGFERSSPAFVRTSWMARAGLLQTDHDPVRLLAETAPLDVMLPLLPYPLGLLRLPWTPPLAVRFLP